MASPFPGMDPYLEHPAVWPGVHQRFITYLADALTSALGKRYFAEIGERIYTESADRCIVPDVIVQHAPGAGPHSDSVASKADEPLVVVLEPMEVREVFLNLIDLRGGNRVVTTIEVLSPTNKQSAGAGFDLYRQKQQEILQSETHLVEIDLLRSGEDVACVPRKRLVAREPFHYRVVISRADDRRRREVHAIHLKQRLPRIGVPLLRPEADAVADLQAILDAVYARGSYADRLDYSRPPVPPLPPGEEEWRVGLLRRS